MSYHLVEIPAGKYGEISKIEEEVLELKDASTQGNKIMELCELSDIIGAVEGYAVQKYGITLEDLILMKNATQRAFLSGHRKPKV